MNFDPIAEQYLKAQNQFYAERENPTKKLILDEIVNIAEERIIDLGCGDGEFLKEIFYKRKPSTAVGIDISNNMLPKNRTLWIARERRILLYGQLPFDSLIGCPHIEGGLHTEIETGNFDVAISRFALHYSIDLEQTFRGIRFRLKPRGKVVAVVAHPLLGFQLSNSKDYWKRESVEVPLYENAIKVDEPRHTFQNYWNAFERNGFRIIKQKESSDYVNEAGLMVPDYYFFVLEKE